MPVMFQALWRYRQFVLSSISSEFSSRFANSKLGGLWAIFNPLAQVAIYALILSNVMQARVAGIEGQYAFAIYLSAGMLAWNLFAEIVSRCVNVFVSNSNLIKKAMFPKIVLPAVAVGSCLLDNIMLFIAILLIFTLAGHFPGISIVWLPLLTLATVALAVGVGLILGVLNVFIRDIGQVVPIVLQILFWFTPIVYPISIIPEAYREYMFLNPMYLLVTAYHDVLVFGVAPSYSHILGVTLVSCVLLLVGFVLFMKGNEEMADVL